MKKRTGLKIAIAVVALLAVGGVGVAVWQSHVGSADGDSSGQAREVTAPDVGAGASGGGAGSDGSGRNDGFAESGPDEASALDAIADAMKPEVDVPCEYATSEDGTRFRKGVVSVTFERSCGEERAREIVRDTGGVWVDSWFGTPETVSFVRVTVWFEEMWDATSGELEEKAAEFERYEEVRHASIVRYDGTRSSDAEEQGLYYLDNSCFDRAWSLQKCSGAVRVAVVDSGFRLSHEDIANNVVYAYDASALSALTIDNFDGDGHGTEVCGVVSAEAGNACGFDGASWNAELMPVRIQDDEGGRPWSYVMRALQFLGAATLVGQGPSVVNMSFESPFLCDDDEEDTQEMLDWMHARKVVFVAAAGNYHVEEGSESITDEKYPACMPHVVSVASVDSSDVVSADSNRNGSVDIAAPGVGIYSTQYNDGYGTDSGTSFAAPQVSAAAALLKAQHPGWSADDVEARLESTARKVPAMGGAERTDAYGHGVLDAYAALGGGASPNTGGSVAELYAEGQW